MYYAGNWKYRIAYFISDLVKKERRGGLKRGVKLARPAGSI